MGWIKEEGKTLFPAQPAVMADLVFEIGNNPGRRVEAGVDKNIRAVPETALAGQQPAGIGRKPLQRVAALPIILVQKINSLPAHNDIPMLTRTQKQKTDPRVADPSQDQVGAAPLDFFHSQALSGIGLEKIEIDTNFGNHSIQGNNPRTGVGIIANNHFVFAVVDRRSSGYSRGVTLTEFAQIFKDLGCTDAYNIDGGGSSTMYFMGRVVNNPLGRNQERGTSDILFIR